MRPEKQDPLEQAEHAATDASELATAGMQRLKEIVIAATESKEEEEEAAPQKEPDRDLGHAKVPPPHPPPHGHPPGWQPHSQAPAPQHPHHNHMLPEALGRMKESAVHAVEGVAKRLHLSGPGGGEPTAEQRTGEAMHMAKAAEGRNQAQDDPIDHALHDALRPERGEKPEAGAFPETLGDALVVAGMRDLPADAPSAAAAASGASALLTAAAGQQELPPPPPANPFSQQARSKL